MPAHFDVPPSINADKLLASLRHKFDIQLVSQQYTLKTYYDSFDWRLWRQGLICELARSKTSSMLNLIDRKEQTVISSTALFDAPTFAQQLNPGKFRKKLEDAIAMRALLTIGTVECDVSHYDIYNEKGTILLRLILEEFVLLRHSLQLLPFKGDGKFVKTVENYLSEDLGFSSRKTPALVELLHLQGRQPKDYSSKISITLNHETDAQLACKAVLLHLLKIIKHNEQGVIADIDIEFLHDFRIAVRKTRIGLKQFKSLLPIEALSTSIAFFNWLGQISSETRDMDVYLLNFEPYQKLLPKNLREDILPLQHYLQGRKAKAQKLLAQKLRSKKYKTGIEKWHEYLTSSIETNFPDHRITVKVFADTKIWKLFKLVVLQSENVTVETSPESLHRLRKTCKKLRYLLEFFQDLYPENKIKKILKALKDLQSVLGNLQDFTVQQNLLDRFSTEMQVSISNETNAAIGMLVFKLEARKTKIHEKCSAELEKFNKPNNRRLYKQLFKSDKPL